ncbi:MAG: MarR family winged helix-turn-helix transcriptional regulator [Wujia sp.]
MQKLDIENLALSNMCRYKKLNDKKLESFINKYGLRRIDLDIMIFLANNMEQDTARDIASTERFTKGHISQSTKRLMEKGYLKGDRDKKDLRIVHLSLTAKAIEFLDEISVAKNEIEKCVFNGITDEEMETLKKIFIKICNNISKELD